MKANVVKITVVAPVRTGFHNRMKEKIRGLKGAHPSSP